MLKINRKYVVPTWLSSVLSRVAYFQIDLINEAFICGSIRNKEIEAFHIVSVELET